MSFKNFRFNIILRVLLITITAFLFVLSFSSGSFFTSIILGAVIGFIIVSIIRYTDRTNRELSNLLESIRYSDFSHSFNFKEMGDSFEELNQAFNDVINDFQKVKLEKEEHFYYLQTILQNIDVSVIAYRKNGNIELINKSAKKLFQVSGLRNIQGLESFSKELVNTLFNIQPGQNKLVKVQDDDDFLQLTIFATNFKTKNNVITLVTIKDIQTVLEEQETEAWQKLIRVLTHEIMNSIAPISSITSTLSQSIPKIESKTGNEFVFSKDDMEELSLALKTINKRSNGLLHFVNTYRNLTKIPNPNFEFIKVNELISNIYSIMENEINSEDINFIIKTEPGNLSITADQHLIEQVIINLIKNAIQALKEENNPEIKIISFYNKRGNATIQVIDNGPGILPDVMEKIFIPFFTTKTNGSGIGLSLSRQILRLHNGSITAQSVPGKETIFTLTF